MAHIPRVLEVAAGGTGRATLTQNGVLVGAGTTAITQTAEGSTGTTLIGTTGSDPSFSAAPTVTSVNFGGTSLSVYAEGTFTPTLVGGTVAGTTSYTVQVGTYTRIGNTVTVFMDIEASGATGTGNATIAGLPFTIKNQNVVPQGPVVFSGAGWAFPASTNNMVIRGNANALTANLQCTASGVASANLVMANAAFVCHATMTYQI